MQNSRITTLLVLFISILFISLPSNSEEIRSFISDIHIHNDGTIVVEENIEYDFGSALRHGIYRDIPYRYSSGLTEFSVRLDVEDVTNFRGEQYVRRE